MYLPPAALLAALPAAPLLTVPEGVLPYRRVAVGKVRELFVVDDDHLLMVATDRLSAFDVVLPTGIAGKGMVLTQLSLWAFAQVSALLPHHLVADHARALAQVLPAGAQALAPRCLLVRRLRPLPVEAVVRGYLSGSGWKAYRQTGRLFHHALPAGLVESSALPAALFTPTTKAAVGDHDEPLDPAGGIALLGAERWAEVERTALALFRWGQQRAAQAGLLLADTKFEFGVDGAGRLHLIDEAFTPDSSRYWPADAYCPGGTQPSFDKQFVRDYLETLPWNKRAPGPALPPDVVARTQARYLEAYQRLVG